MTLQDYVIGSRPQKVCTRVRRLVTTAATVPTMDKLFRVQLLAAHLDISFVSRRNENRDSFCRILISYRSNANLSPILFRILPHKTLTTIKHSTTQLDNKSFLLDLVSQLS